jgi:hypothetical protein
LPASIPSPSLEGNEEKLPDVPRGDDLLDLVLFHAGKAGVKRLRERLILCFLYAETQQAKQNQALKESFQKQAFLKEGTVHEVPEPLL